VLTFTIHWTCSESKYLGAVLSLVYQDTHTFHHYCKYGIWLLVEDEDVVKSLFKSEATSNIAFFVMSPPRKDIAVVDGGFLSKWTKSETEWHIKSVSVTSAKISL
jgi:hypothetical protein